MNRQIIKLFGFIVVLFAILIGFTSWWSVFDAKALKEEDANKRPLFEQQQIPRGRILAADGSVIAKSLPKGKGSGRRYVRHYPLGKLFGHPIGYSFMEYGQSEFEKYHNAELTGEESEFGSILDELTGQKQEGEQIVTNLDRKAQEVAMGDLEAAGYGAVVAIEPSTGAVKVLASNPSYNPNRVPEKLSKWNTEDVRAPLVNRATFARYPPGSTFKVVTAAAGLESGVITPETAIDAPGSIEDEGHELANDYDQDWGEITLDTALTNSVNTWFAQLGQKVGQDKLFAMMEKFGFNATPPIDLPEEEVFQSGVYDYETEKMLTRHDPVDLGRLAIGQERLLVTPLQDAMVAAAVANHGKLMKPQIWKRVVNVDGSVTKTMKPSVYSEPLSAKTAAELTTAMEGVVDEGTGTNAAIPGVPVAGKTGTAEVPGNKACGGGSEENQAWFIGFAPADHPKIAIAASVECTTAFGNDVAAPIFRDVAETILAGK
ncbi:MAG TPA: penicillin-binding transpeptidase domain-containing protein [Solirubrobacterales bacterium]|nr:penicillin-binding transpeptidase domain-containing protein [Solirubrobacterales bacterium]